MAGLVLWLTLGITGIKMTASASSSFYNNYEYYPPYCSVPSEMESRTIPPLRDYIGTSTSNAKNTNSNHNNDNDNINDNINDSSNSTTRTKQKLLIGETRLVHVTAVIRHGARTPWSSEMKCWDGFWDSPQTGKWDCDDLTTFMAAPSRNGRTLKKTNDNNSSKNRNNPTDNDNDNDNGNDNDNDSAFFLFEKRYDALNFPEEGLTNVLNGTCEMGQLLQQGYEQQLQNGKILRDAYTYRKGEYDHDERMRLLDLGLDDENHPPWQHPDQLYFRADDYQRTVMSGQVLLSGLFGPEFTKIQSNNHIVIPLHIADEDKDIVDANEHDCPRLHSIKTEAMQSPEYQAFINSQNSQQALDFMQKQLKMGDDTSVLDCVMCTLCTDRPLPKAVDDYDGTAKNWFSRLTEYEIQKYTTIMKHNNAEYAKLGIGPLWYEIMKHINRVVSEEGERDTSHTPPKLALFAGHDTTLMPLLASLGPDLWKDTDWASYASMMLIEIHELIDGRSEATIYTSKFAFRLLYNGKILTPMVNGCHEACELCDIVHLKTILDPIARRDVDCSVPVSVPTQDVNREPFSSSSENVSNAKAESSSLVSLTTTTGMAIFVTLVLLSGFGGSAITVVIMRKRFSNAITRRRMDFGTAWDIDETSDREHGLELTEGGVFRDERLYDSDQKGGVSID